MNLKNLATNITIEILKLIIIEKLMNLILIKSNNYNLISLM